MEDRRADSTFQFHQAEVPSADGVRCPTRISELQTFIHPRDGGEVRTDKFRQQLIAAHTGSPYYNAAEQPENIAKFWGDSSIFRRMFSELDLDKVVDLACGEGRHTAQIVGTAGHVTMVDANQAAIDYCRNRFADRLNVTFVVNSGADLYTIASSSQTSLFSYDAMVHFEPIDVIHYVEEIARILRPGGRALLHYSNSDDNYGTYADNPEWRNFFSEKMMKAFAYRSCLSVLQSVTIPWGTASDAISLLERE